MWSEKVPDDGYNQSYQMGFYYLKTVNTRADGFAMTVQIPCDTGMACGEVLQNDNPHICNDLGYNGEAVYAIQPKDMKVSVEHVSFLSK